MKKYIIISLCIVNALSSMNQNHSNITYPEWDVQKFATFGKQIHHINQHFRTMNKIETDRRIILNISCKRGEEAAQLAQNAQHVDAIDSDTKMIEHAQQQFSSIKNITFQQCCMEELILPSMYDLALICDSFYSLHDKQQALKNIFTALKKNGEFFACVDTTATDPHNTVFNAFITTAQKFPKITGDYVLKKFNNGGNLTDEHVQYMLQQAGFTLITYAPMSYTCVAEEKQIKAMLESMIESHPVMKDLPEQFFTLFFEPFFNSFLSKLTKNEDNSYTWIYTTNVIHARKIIQ